MSNTLSHVEFAQAYEQWKNRGWDSSVQAFAVQINDIPNRKRIDWLNNSEIAYDRLTRSGVPDEFVGDLFNGVYDDDIEAWLNPELAEDPEFPYEEIHDDSVYDGEEGVPYLDN